MPADAPARVTLARIVRARGRRGEVAAEILTDFPERLTRLRQVWLCESGRRAQGARADRLARVRECWISPSRGSQAIFHFEGSDSISQAQELVGLEVQVPFEERMPLPAGRYYISDLIGCEVWEWPASAGQGREKPELAVPELLGTVREVQTAGGGTPLLVVETSAGEVLIPLAEEFCLRVDPAARRIEVLLPEGLRDLNR